ncbi:MAG: iron-sulfur cluster-binding protein [Bacillaceae bacterium]|nr:iron-sulfur cluster-binding protein [Bacillaceae bacterium]
MKQTQTQAEPIPFYRRVDEALKDPMLQKAVTIAQDRLRNGRIQAGEILGNVDEWRKRAEEIRRHTIENLDSYLEQLAANVQKAGGKVHFASDGDEAVSIIKTIAQEKQARSVVKSKSMVTEEIGLNEALEEMNIDVAETDLGEYIIQLAGEKPSHIIAPAIHKTREQVAELFSEKGKKRLSSETPELTAFAREQLRNKFINADIGISGCNFAVAESGSVVLVSNEGNARMTTTLPKTHIAVMGMERIAPTWRDLDVLLSMLVRSATGQKISVYVTALTGPRRAEDADGPEEFHLVVLDNGRSDILGTKYQDVLHCIRCGACLNVCPVYRHIGGHAYGGVYSGPIGAVLSPLLDGYDQWGELPYASSLCGACTEACPVRIPLHDLLIEHRQDMVNQGDAPMGERLLMKAYGFSTSRPGLYEKALKWGYRAAGFISDGDTIKKGPGPLKGWTDHRDFPRPASQSFREWWQKEKKGDS